MDAKRKCCYDGCHGNVVKRHHVNDDGQSIGHGVTQSNLTSCRKCSSSRLDCNKRLPKKSDWLLWNPSVVTMVTCCLFILVTPCLAIQEIQVENDVNDIKDFLTVLDDADLVEVTDEDKKAISREPVSVKWGIPDTTAIAGKLFHYMLPNDAFRGDITGYTVTEAGEEALPDWMYFNEQLRALQGLPDIEDLGKQFLLQATAISQFTNDTLSHAKDIFAVNVAEDNVHTPTSATPLKEATTSGNLKPIRCAEPSAVTMVTVIVDTDLNKLSAAQKVALMQNMGGHLRMPAELLRLTPVGNKPMFDSSALVAGPGDVKKPSYSGAVMQWEVGCGNVNANHMPILQQLESTSSDSSMSNAVGHGIIGWHVTNNKPHAPHRMKRQAAVMATPTVMATVGPPTHQPVPTYVIDEEDKPATKFIPTMSSPVFPGMDIKPTKSKHKHHHRTKTKGRHQHKTKHMKHSPTKKHHGHKTMVLKTPMPTPTVLPIQPTRVLDLSPTIIDKEWERPIPTVAPASPGISRTDPGIVEPSMTRTDQTDKGNTDELPKKTFVIPDVKTTEHIDTSDVKDTFTPPTKEPPTREPTKEPTRMPTKEPTTKKKKVPTATLR